MERLSLPTTAADTQTTARLGRVYSGNNVALPGAGEVEQVSSPEPIWEKAVIVGVGLLGGSIGLALRGRGLAREIIGVGRPGKPPTGAVASGAIDRAEAELAVAAQGADLVICCAPVQQIPELVATSARVMHPGGLIPDVGSTKRTIVDEVEQAAPGAPSFTSIYYYLPGWVTVVSLFVSCAQFPFAMILENVKSWKVYAYLLLFPVFLLSWWPITMYAFFTQNNKTWSHTKHTRVLRLEEVQGKQM